MSATTVIGTSFADAEKLYNNLRNYILPRDSKFSGSYLDYSIGGDDDLLVITFAPGGKKRAEKVAQVKHFEELLKRHAPDAKSSISDKDQFNRTVSYTIFQSSNW